MLNPTLLPPCRIKTALTTKHNFGEHYFAHKVKSYMLRGKASKLTTEHQTVQVDMRIWISLENSSKVRRLAVMNQVIFFDGSIVIKAE